MTRLDTLKSLQSRIREATGADRELDAEICAVLRYGPRDECSGFLRSFPVWRVKEYGRVEVIDDSGSPGPWFTCAELTTDPDGLGACVALMREVLPGWHGSVAWGRADRRGACFASAQVPFGYDGPGPWPEGWGHNNNACLALLDAICAALIAEEEAKEKADV